MHWMLLPLRRYATFGGRSRRMEYWMFVLFTTVCTAVLTVLDMATGLEVRGDDGSRIGFLSTLFGLATLIPGIAVAVRRLHDIGRPGWWLLLPLPAVLGGFLAGAVVGAATGSVAAWTLALSAAGLAVAGIALLVFAATPGARGANRYGGDPKEDGHG